MIARPPTYLSIAVAGTLLLWQTRFGRLMRPGTIRKGLGVMVSLAAQNAFDTARNSYARGVGSFTDAATAEATPAGARATLVRAHTQSLVNAAGLAFATGALNAATVTGVTGALS